MKNIAFIINPMSGTQNKRRLPKIINELLDKRQWLENIVFTERPGHATTLAKQFALMEFDAVVAVGGDGTVKEVAEGLAGTRSALGIIPMGMTNSLARHLGLPLRGNAAIQWLNRSEVLLCDTLKVRIDEEAPMVAVSMVSLNEKTVLNCEHTSLRGVRASIQDGLLTMEGEEPCEAYTISGAGTAVIDGEEFACNEQVAITVMADNLHILAPKRF